MDVNNYNLIQLKNAGNYLNLKRLCKGGLVSVIWGFINIFFGLFAITYDPINVFIPILGVFMIIVGFWVIIVPSVKGLLIEGITFLLLRGWNIFITLYNIIVFGYVGIGFSLILGGFQIGWATDYFSKYNKYRKMDIYKPSKDLLKTVKRLMKSTRKANPKYQLDIISMKVFDSQNKGIWNGRLLGNIAFFVSKKKRTVFFADKNTVNIEKTGQKMLSKKLKVAF